MYMCVIYLGDTYWLYIHMCYTCWLFSRILCSNFFLFLFSTWCWELPNSSTFWYLMCRLMCETELSERNSLLKSRFTRELSIRRKVTVQKWLAQLF